MGTNEIKHLSGNAWRIKGGADAPLERQVVWLPKRNDREGWSATWMQKVAGDSTADRTIFVEPADPLRASLSIMTITEEHHVNGDVQAAMFAMKTQGNLDPADTMLVSHGRVHERLVSDLDKDLEGVPDTIWTDLGLRARLDCENEMSMFHLVEHLRSSLGVIPFIGAGMSAPFQFPQWGTVLRNFAELSPDAAMLKEQIEDDKYEDVAEYLRENDEDRFQKWIDCTFRRELDPDKLGCGPLAILAELVDGPVITTNFDHVVERSFEGCGKPFTQRVFGRQPDRIVRAIQQNQRVLLKIHGDCEDRTDRTFTQKEYYDSYETGITIGSLARLMFTNRPLLFLGCSLDRDKTVDILRDIHEELRGLTHFAVIAGHYSARQLADRGKILTECGIFPIWFPPGEFGEIEQIVRHMLDRSSSREISPPTGHGYAPIGPEPGEQPTTTGGLTPGDPNGPSSDPPAGQPKGLAAAPTETPVDVGDLQSVVDRIARAVVQGRVAFFLGARAHFNNMPSGNEFYETLRKQYDVPTTMKNRAEVAHYIQRRFGFRALWEAHYDCLQKCLPIEPSIVYQMLAALPALLRAENRNGSQLILTTNQDTVMEDCFRNADEPYHLLYYLSDGVDRGRFAHLAPDGRERIIDRPDGILELGDESIVVKMNGGMIDAVAIPKSVVISSGDINSLAGRLPDVLPVVIRRELKARSLLFLAHGLAEADTRALIYHACGNGRKESWAIQLGTTPESIKYWDEFGLQVINIDLEKFMLAMDAAIRR